MEPDTAAFVVRSDPAEGVVLLTLNRPQQKNALSIALRDALSELLLGLAEEPAARVVVLTGAGRVFSAGFDLKEFRRIGEVEFADRIWASSDRFHKRLLSFPLPLVAAVNGPAVAGGFDLAAMCDLRVAASNASFSHPEVAFGEVAFGLLHDLLGGAVARELCLLGREVTAEEALALRLVTRVVPEENLLKATIEMAIQVARSPVHVLRSSKAKIRRRSGNEIRGTLDL